MASISTGNLRAILFLRETGSGASLFEAVTRNGFEVFVADDFEAGLAEHRREPFELAIVEEGYESRSASSIIQELLKISWTTHAIIISDADESQLHDETEGLGILGSIRDGRDVKKLDELVVTLKKILGLNRS